MKKRMPEEPQLGDALSPATETVSPDVAVLPLAEDVALSQLKRRDLAADEIRHIVQDASLMKSRKIRLVLAGHPQTPRRLALRIIRELYSLELMRFALAVGPAADLKRIADELLVGRLATISLGEKISLARRSSEMVAGALLLDKEKRVWSAALENPRMAERAVVKALQKSSASVGFVGAVSRHPKWCVRPEVSTALLRNAHTPLARAIEFASRVPPKLLRDILHTSHLPDEIKGYLRAGLRRARHDDENR
jgi:hypothetical protein